MIDQEMLTPGASFRAFLARDYPELVGGLTGGRDRDVHLLIDQQSTTAKSVFELLVLTQPHDPPVPELQLAVIANAMELVLRTCQRSPFSHATNAHARPALTRHSRD